MTFRGAVRESDVALVEAWTGDVTAAKATAMSIESADNKSMNDRQSLSS